MLAIGFQRGGDLILARNVLFTRSDVATGLR
jgi:hypothetical protein